MRKGERVHVQGLTQDVMASEMALRSVVAGLLLQAYDDACALAKGSLPPGEAVLTIGLSEGEKRVARREKMRTLLEDLKEFLRSPRCEEMCEVTHLDPDAYRAKLGLALVRAEARLGTRRY